MPGKDKSGKQNWAGKGSGGKTARRRSPTLQKWPGPGTQSAQSTTNKGSTRKGSHVTSSSLRSEWCTSIAATNSQPHSGHPVDFMLRHSTSLGQEM